MKRRGFLSFMGGAAVAGPGMAKQAAASLVDLQLPGIATSIAASGDGYGFPVGGGGPNDHWVRELAKHLARTPEQIAWEKKRMEVHRLDPDLAAMKSIALHAKIRMQRDRDHERNERSRRDWLERAVMGWFD